MIKIILSLFVTTVSFGLIQAQITTYPYNQDFEGENVGSNGCGDAYTMQSTGWTNETLDDIDWTGNMGGTVSSSTGPSIDHTTGTANGYYLYTESSSPCYSSTAVLYSPTLDLTSVGAATGAEMSIWYHMYGSSMGTLTIAVTSDGGTTWTDISAALTDNLDSWQEFTYDASAHIGQTIQFRFTALTGTSFYSDMAIDDFSINLSYSDDVGAVSVDAPTNPVSTGVQFVTSSIYNYGTNTVTTADVNWSVNSVVQTPVTYTGSLAPSATASGIVLGAYDFQPGMTEICVWTSNPNATTDNQPGNDSICVIRCTGLNGTYTIGGATPDYATFNDAVNDLTQCGISGPVIFDVAAGTYNENVVLPPITGASATNTITFQGAGASSTILTHDATMNATVYLQGGDYIKFSDMTIETTGTSDAWCVFLSDTAQYDTIQNCNLTMPVGSYTDVAAVVASADITDDFTEGNNANYCVFDNNYITGGERAFAFEGPSTYANYASGLTVTNNEIYHIQDYGIYGDNLDSLVFSNNHIDSILNSLGDGVYLTDISNFTFERNMINAPDYGFYISDGNYNGNGPASGMSKIINNMISSTSDYGMYLYNVEMTNIWYNSIRNEGSTTAALDIANMMNCDVQNNIFFSVDDYAFDSFDDFSTNGNTFDYNSYFTVNGANLAVVNSIDYIDLAAWQTAQPSQNVNSVEENPLFFSSTDLHVSAIPINDIANGSLGVNVDIDGDVRPLGSAPDIGADEFTPLADDAVMLEILTPTSLVCGDANTEIKVAVTNYGSNNITSLPIEVQITGDITQTLNTTYTNTIVYDQVDTVTVGVIDTYNGASISLLAITQLSGDQNTVNDSLTTTADYLSVEPKAGGGSPTCGADSAYVWADTTYTSSYAWYDAPTGGTQVASGSSYWIPSVSTQDTYYIEYISGVGLSGLPFYTTTFAGGNGCGGGNMFDITSTTGDTLAGIAVSSGAAAGTTVPVSVYYRTGTYSGNETTPGAWTFAGDYNVVSGGAGNPSEPLALTSPIILPAGQTVGIYVYYDADYTTGANSYTFGNITVDCGTGLCSLFGGTNLNRTFNGELYFGTIDPCSTIRTPVQANITDPADVNLGPDSTACQQNGNVILDPGTNLSNFLWWPSGTTDSTFTVTSNGQYSVTATDVDGCTNSDTIVVFFVDCLGLEEYNGISGLNIFPNPTTGQFEVQANLDAGVSIEAIEIRSLDGKLIRSSQGTMSNNFVSESFNLSKEESGVYFIRILTSEGISVEKITIE